MKIVNVEPVWKNMFGLAVQLVKDGLPKERGKDVVIQMLEFGGRLHEAHEECVKDHYTYSPRYKRYLDADGLISTKEME